jgi:hypothetical protein
MLVTLVTLAGCAVCLWGVSGCESKTMTTAAATVSGKVLFKGRPLNGGDMAFFPKTGIPFSCKINADGSFSAGLPDQTRGEVVVTVRTTAETTTSGRRQPAEAKEQQEKMLAKIRKEKGMPLSAGPPVEIPGKYAQKDTSPLRWTLAEGSNTKDFDLTD